MPDSLTKFQKDETKKSAPAAAVVTSPTAPVNVADISSFQLKDITSSGVTYHIHQFGFGNSTKECSIPKADLTDGNQGLQNTVNDIVCWLEADEVALNYNGAQFQINSPIATCDFVEIHPYYYWNAPPANTVKILKEQKCDSGSVGCTASAPSDSDKVCYGDQTPSGGKNCDEGFIQINTYNKTAPSADGLTPGVDSLISSVKIDCAGKRSNCYGGPGPEHAFDFIKRPVATDHMSYLGISLNYRITPPGIVPGGKQFDGNFYISNYTTLFATTQYDYDYTKILSGVTSATGLDRFSKTSSTSHKTYTELGITNFDNKAGIVAGSIAVVDIANDPLKTANSSLIKKFGDWGFEARDFAVNPFYEFSCLNYAKEVKGRIRLQIREWNKQFVAPTATNTEVSESAPASLIKQSANITDFETSGVDYWNDVASWDFIYNYGSSAGTIPATSGVLSTGYLFPKDGFNQ